MIQNARIEKLYKAGIVNTKAFRPISDYIVEHYVSDVPGGTQLGEAARAVISECSAIDMAVGARSVRNKYLLTGVLVGVAAVIVFLGVRKLVKNQVKLSSRRLRAI